MAIDWFGFAYAGAIIMGGVMGYKRKGSVMSLIAGLLFGTISAYGAYRVSSEPRDVAVSLIASGALAVVMGLRFKKSGKLIPAGFMAGISLLMVLRLLLMTLG